MIGSINGKRPMQRWINIVKSDLEKYAPVSKLEECDDRDRWNQVVEKNKALNRL